MGHPRSASFLARAAARAAALVAVLGAGAAAPALAQSFSPPGVARTLGVGETFTINKSLTLGATGATTVDLFFLADNTGSMGSVVGNAKAGAGAILGALPSTYRFGVGRYVGDPVEGVPRDQSYVQNTGLTFDKMAAQTGINAWFASGGGDTPEANFFALQQVANTAGWRPEAQRLVVWFGDAPSHTETTTQAQAITALQGANAKVVGFNNLGAGGGIDESGQASAVVAAAGGALVNNFATLAGPSFINAVLGQISSATSRIDLVFGTTFVGGGLALSFACTDVLGCTNVGAGETRTFDLNITGVEPGDYTFDVFARGVDARATNRITVVATAVPEPAPAALTAAGVGLLLAGAARRRRA